MGGHPEKGFNTKRVLRGSVDHDRNVTLQMELPNFNDQFEL
jgi:hypothetical protein